MRVVDVNEFYSPTGGGVRTYLQRKMAIMAELGHELIVIAPGPAPRVEERPGGGTIHFVKGPSLALDRNYHLFWEAAPVRALLDRLQPDVVECSSPWRPAWIVGGWQGAALKSFFMHNDNVATYPQRWFEDVASPRGVERAFGWYTRYMRRFLARYDTVLTNGPALEQRLRARGVRIDAAMPLGIERGYFTPELRDEGLRARLLAQCGLGPEATLLLGIGRHHAEKRWPLVIEAVTRAGREVPLGLVQLGRGPHTARLEKLVRGHPNIRLLAPEHDRERLARIMASADALIHGSETEPFGLVAAEAVAAGLPLIVPDSGGCTALADPQASELYAARDVASCTAAILRLVARDPAMRRRAALLAAGRVRSDRQHVADLLAHYDALLAERRLRAA
jgi:alpha-1,6-mannosyltransferase